MNTTKDPFASVYLTRPEIDIIIVGLSEALKKHYYNYEDSIPHDEINILAKMQDIHNAFKRCQTCGSLYHEDYSWTKCCKEEEE